MIFDIENSSVCRHYSIVPWIVIASGTGYEIDIIKKYFIEFIEKKGKKRILPGKKKLVHKILSQFTDKAKVIFAPPEIHLPYGKSAVLDCHFRSNPPLTNLRWEKDGFLFDPYNVQVKYWSDDRQNEKLLWEWN